MNQKPVIFLMMTLLMLIAFPQNVEAETTIVYIDPSLRTGLSIGETFPINVTVANTTNLYAWAFQICYKSDILNASSWTLGSVFKSPDAFNVVPVWTDNYNGTHGLIQIDCTFLGEVPTFNGTTTLATVYFKVKTYGSTLLHLQNTLLLDDTVPFPQEMPHTTADGTVRAGLSDLAVTNMTVSKNFANDTIVWIEVTVANYGGQYETFNVTLYYDSTEISTKIVKDLAPTAMLNINFTWDTTQVPKGNYTLTAKAQPLLGEMNLADNTLAGGWIIETIRGDVTGDYKVDINDIYKFGRAFGTTPEQIRWNPNCDLNNDGQINIQDIFYAARNFGKQT